MPLYEGPWGKNKKGLLNISLPQIQAQEEIAIISCRECSNKHALSLFEGSVQSCPEILWFMSSIL